MKQRSLFEQVASLDDVQAETATMTPKEKAFAYQVAVCERIRQDYPDASFGPGFAWRDFSDERYAANERIYEAFLELRKDYPDAQPSMFLWTPGRSEYGRGKVAGWRDILHAQRRELERR